MQQVRSSASYLKEMLPYDPKYLPARIYLNANESPYGLPAGVRQLLMESIAAQMLHRYPDPLAKSLRVKIAEMNGVSPENVLLGNGGDELLLDLFLAYGGSGRTVLTAPPSFSSYELDAALTNTRIVEVPRIKSLDETGLRNTFAKLGIDHLAVLAQVSQGTIDMVILTSPNNPSGDAIEEVAVVELLNASDALVLIDQAYIEFADARFDVKHLLDSHKNLVILRTFSKAYALAGIRLGYLLASEHVINELCKVRQPYSVDVFAVLAGQAVLSDLQAFEQQIAESIAERSRVAAELNKLPGITVYESEANFLLLETNDAHRAWKKLYDDNGILLRDFSHAAHLTNCLRASIGIPSENNELLAAIKTLIGEGR